MSILSMAFDAETNFRVIFLSFPPWSGLDDDDYGRMLCDITAPNVRAGGRLCWNGTHVNIYPFALTSASTRFSRHGTPVWKFGEGKKKRKRDRVLLISRHCLRVPTAKTSTTATSPRLSYLFSYFFFYFFTMMKMYCWRLYGDRL